MLPLFLDLRSNRQFLMQIYSFLPLLSQYFNTNLIVGIDYTIILFKEYPLVVVASFPYQL
nr:MAG TPA: hypothetical protein [Caudoviricetes sp.]